MKKMSNLPFGLALVWLCAACAQPPAEEAGVVEPEPEVQVAEFVMEMPVTTASEESVALSVWDTTEGKALMPRMPFSESIQHAMFSPDGRYIFTVYANNSGHLWPVERDKAATAEMLMQETGRLTGARERQA